MKKNISIITIISLFFIITSCEDQFLEKKIGNDINVDSIFSTREKVLSAIVQAYSMNLVSGIVPIAWDGNRRMGLTGGPISWISDEINAIKFDWSDGWKIPRMGLTQNDGTGKPLSTDGFVFNYECFHQDYLVINNIDKVIDMNDVEKKAVKAEMKTLMAYRYEEMLKRYGGVPIVKRLLTATDNVMIPRATVEETVNHIIELCDEAYPDLLNVQPNNSKGRVTKGVALAIKAETYMLAARPLFNSSTPYLNLSPNNNLICYGNYDVNRWQKAIDANLELLQWASSNGYRIINTGSPLDDYGNAVSTPNNVETLLAYKAQNAQGMELYDPHTPGGGANAMSYAQLTKYYKSDGTNQTWAGEEYVPYTEYVTKVNEMEARYKESAIPAGMNAWNNPGSEYWSTQVLSYASPTQGYDGTEGAGRRAKFWYHAGTRNWFEFPIYRLAEFYLNLAEAYNEIGNAPKALEYLNVIRNRAGLPNETETNQSRLREIVQREWAIEFYEENHRYYDVKHWKHPDIANGIIGGDKKAVVFKYKNNNYGVYPADYIAYAVKYAYTGFWSNNQYLEPFPITEVNKGYLIQNPGY